MHQQHDQITTTHAPVVQQQGVIIQDAQGRLYQVTPVQPAGQMQQIAPTSYYQRDRLYRQQVNARRNQTANQISVLIFAIGGMFAMGIFFFIFAGLFAAATRPAAAPAHEINPNCVINCGV